MMKQLQTLLALLLLQTSAFAQTAQAAKPPMGWNSWNHFQGQVTDADIRATADALVDSGMRDAGYVYVNVDDTWQGKRDSKGIIHPNERFPDMKALADYVHSKGLKFGIYSSPGAQTCARFEGSLGHEEQDAKTYAAWGVDFLKYDLCTFQDNMSRVTGQAGKKKLMIDAYRKMGNALHATGRPILYSLCQYGLDDVWEWGPQVGAQMWRSTDDIHNSYERMYMIANDEASLSRFAGPGHWNDPDMLEIGNGKLTVDEAQTHMSLWALLAAPLLAGNDLKRMSDADRNILMNRDVIGIDQDSLGRQGERVLEAGDFAVWTKKLIGGRIAIGVFNSAWSPFDYTVDLKTLGLVRGAKILDVWAGNNLGDKKGKITHRIAGHGVWLLIVQPL